MQASFSFLLLSIRVHTYGLHEDSDLLTDCIVVARTWSGHTSNAIFVEGGGDYLCREH